MHATKVPKRNVVLCAAPSKHSDKLAVIRQHKLRNKLLVAQIAPAVRVGIGEPLGCPVTAKQLVSVLKREFAFDHVFDTLFAADLTICEEGTEFLRRLVSGELDACPMFTSCCPGWMELVDKQFPDLKSMVSSCKSPQMMMGALVKKHWAPTVMQRDPADVFMVSVMPCVKKQGEADRPQYQHDVDLVITTHEMASMILDRGVDMATQPEAEFDRAMGSGSGSAVIFGRTGGVMMAALRYTYSMLTNGQPMPSVEFTETPVAGVTEATIVIPKVTEFKVAVVVGLGAAKKLAKIAQAGEAPYKFVEVMACAPAGCVSGGGQPPVGLDKGKVDVRRSALDALDTGDAACDNRTLMELYDGYLVVPGSDVAHHLLHEPGH